MRTWRLFVSQECSRSNTMASFGSATFGYSYFGPIIFISDQKLGGIIRMEIQHNMPSIIRIASEDGMHVERIQLPDTSIKTERFMGEETLAIIRVHNEHGLRMERVTSPDDILRLEREVSDGTLAVTKMVVSMPFTVEFEYKGDL